MPATHLHVTQWDDPAEKTSAFAERSDLVWVSILGPSAFMLLIFLQALVYVDPWEHSIDLDWFSQTLGLGTCDSKHAPIFRAIARLVHFGLAKRMAKGELAVRCKLALPTPQQLGGLSPRLQVDYQESIARDVPGGRDLPANASSPRVNPIVRLG
jgi:hypothetical protein